MFPEVVSGMMTHAASYVRQSAARGNKSEASPASQRAANKARFEQLPGNAVWCGHYEDIGISAFNGKTRPQFERLLNDCRAGRVNMVIVYYVSRLSRMEPLDAIPIVTEMLNLGVVLVSVTEGEFRKGNLMDLIHLIMRLDAAHQESKNKSTAVRDAAKTARELGGYVGGKAPYGRKLKEDIRTNHEGKPVAVQVLDTDEDEAKVIKDVWATIKRHKHVPTVAVTGRAAPGSIGNIVAQLNRDGIPTQGASRGKKTKNGQWHIGTLMRILRHPHVAGFQTEPMYEPQKNNPDKLRVVGHKIVRDDKGNPVRMWKPILDPADWHELQAWLDKRPQRKWESRVSTLLSSQEILECECLRPMGGGNSKKPRGGSYSCSRQRGVQPKNGEHEGGVSISQASLDDYVARRIFAVIQTAEENPESLEIIRAATELYGMKQEAPERAQERATLLTERSDAVRALETLYDMQASYMGNEIGRTRFAKEVATQEARMAGAEQRIAELAALDSPVLPIGEWLNLEDPLADPLGPGSWWHGASLAERRAFVACFIKKIVIRKALPQEKSRGKNARSEVRSRTTIHWVTSPTDDNERP
ncbi:recombinase family protein [Streptomyces chartreusis]|uniref:recombinase family protein n=1 Tax=Streptomyces chartreusis TaxID=1969 RepID=UPI003866CFD3|nr:recombinase family protein [Streptomyces chartreusis]WTA29156.1 recombinase family protein [Streptomyces chartreusis]